MDAVPEEDSEDGVEEEPENSGAEVDESAPAAMQLMEVGGASGSEQRFTRAHAIDELKQIVQDATGDDTSGMELEDVLGFFSELFPLDDPREDIIQMLESLN